MVDDRSAPLQQRGLQHAAAVIFALVAVVPLLIFAWTLHALGAIRSTQAQVSLGLALGIALLGLWMFRSLLARMAEVVQALAAALEQAGRTRRAPAPPLGLAPGAPAGPGVAPAPETAKASRTPAPPPALVAAAVAPRVVEPRAAVGVAGLGTIRELSEVARTMDALWHREASAHLNYRVQISVANSREPLVGTLREATADGLILEQPDGPLPIAYGRVTAIDRLS